MAHDYVSRMNNILLCRIIGSLEAKTARGRIRGAGDGGGVGWRSVGEGGGLCLTVVI